MSGSSGCGPQADRAEAWPGPAGWFGKIPALGDFASRRLPPEFISAWDDWLSEGLPEAQQSLGADWLECYLKAPIWCFALTPGVLDARPWCGVLMPSVDRVGRQYPLTFAASFAPRIEIARPWWSALIEVAMRVKEPGCDAEALETRLLAAQGVPPCVAAGPIESPLATALAGAGPATSLWWPWSGHGPDDQTGSALDGLPRGDRFVRLFALNRCGR
jgi:type VI secretion system protein ImpM